MRREDQEWRKTREVQTVIGEGEPMSDLVGGIDVFEGVVAEAGG
jgi:hypothetical protein